MTSGDFSAVDLERELQWVRDDAAHRRRMLDPAPWQLPGFTDFHAAWTDKDRYALRDFLALHDVAFVEAAYRALLGREPDPQGSESFLHALRTGELSKVEILGRIRYSAEGRRKAVPVDGLAVPFAVRSLARVPVLGYVFETAKYLLRLPVIARNHERLEATFFFRETTLATLAADLRANAAREQERLAYVTRLLSDALKAHARSKAERASLEHLAATVSDLDRELRHAVARLQRDKADRPEVATLQGIATELDSAVAALQGTATELGVAVEALRNAKADQERLEEIGASLANLRQSLAHELDHPGDLDDRFWTDLEQHFRGARDEIKKRVAEHLPAMTAAGAGTNDAPIVDLGCGRGEWLEVLRENGLVARGVDLNVATVADSAALGLEVVQGDAVEYLRALPERSIGAVTAFHLIEHLAFQDLVALLDQTLRVLRPGGVALFETPNPENLLVGSWTFWYDPTHRKPLPPELMQFVCTARGFSRADIVRLHPVSYDRHLSQGDEQIRHRLNELLYGWQDYAVVAHKDASQR